MADAASSDDRDNPDHDPMQSPLAKQVVSPQQTAIKKANEWNIRITVGHRLGANLHQANHGHERAQKP